MSLLRNILLCSLCLAVQSNKIALPPFAELKKHYPGFHNSGGLYHRHSILRLLQIQDNPDMLLHDTSALRMSYTLNRIGNQHSLGSDVIRLSKYGTDSIKGRYGLQYIFHPLAFGPYLADKYGYPNVSKLHLFDPVKTKKSFENKQGIMRVITYTQRDNEPKGHVVLWDCNGFYKARDFMSGHTLLSVEFWESPDSNCDDNHQTLSQSQEKPHSTILSTEKTDSIILPKESSQKTVKDTVLKSLLLQNQRHPVQRHQIRHNV